MFTLRARAFGLATTILLTGGLRADAQKAPEQDPFADIAVAHGAEATPAPAQSWMNRFTHSNFGFRKEIMSEFTFDQDGNAASRQSLGFEVLKKFSTETSTLASFNFQGRMVRRDGFNPVMNDMEGQSRPGWAFEYHNVYLDFYNVLNPLLGSERKGKNAGRFNIRAGRFYVPFGLNTQTDTHGTVLQLSNEDNFGFERDWYVGMRGMVNRHFNYDAYYMVGSGYALRYNGQRGLAALRLSLAGQYSARYGLEGGLSVIAGDRLAAGHGGKIRPVSTQRIGLDGRYRHAVNRGTLTFTNEISGGLDARNSVFTELHEGEYLHASRRWGLATQYRRFWQDPTGVDASVVGEVSWYFRNDPGSSNLHWVKFDVERRLSVKAHGPYSGPFTVIALQYYLYR